MDHYITLSHQNKMTFTCPVFDTATTMGSCMKLRDLVWRGERPAVRKGCQACMHSSKCPALVVANDIIHRNGEAPDAFGSIEPRKGKLTDDVLQRIYPVIVQEHHVKESGATQAEQDLIYSANERISKQMKTAPKLSESAPRPIKRAKPRKTASGVEKAGSAKSSAKEAAKTGDLSAAINEGSE